MLAASSKWHSPRRCLGHRQVERRTLQELGTESRSVFAPCFFPVFLTDVFTASSDVIPFFFFCPPLRHLDLWLVTMGITSIPYTCVGRFLSARLL